VVTFGSTGLALLAEGVVDAGQLQRHAHDREVVSSGLRRLDPLLPGGGVRRGSLIEWLADGEGSGATTLAGLVACRLTAASSARTIVVVDRRGWFHPPALMPWLARQTAPGHHGPRLIVARPAGDDDEIWAIDQALRCSGVAAVVAWPRMAALWSGQERPARGHAFQQWTTAMRRWQLAARGSGAVGLFVRPEAALREPSWAEARIAVTPLPSPTDAAVTERSLRVEIVGGAWNGRGGAAAGPVDVVLDLLRPGEATPRRGVPQAFSAGGAACLAS
jgi:hypothetical protein